MTHILVLIIAIVLVNQCYHLDQALNIASSVVISYQVYLLRRKGLKNVNDYNLRFRLYIVEKIGNSSWPFIQRSFQFIIS